MFPDLTPIVGDGMEVGGGVLPGNGSARSNVDEFRGIIRKKRAHGNSKGRWSGKGQRTNHQQTDEQEA